MPDGLCFVDFALFVQQFKTQLPKASQTGAVRLSQIQLRTANRTNSPFSILHSPFLMSTFLFDEIVFGPVRSRRLGVSLGINLLPTECKYCNFDCIYCECGKNDLQKMKEKTLPTRPEIITALEQKLTMMQQSGQLPDAITFAGNGEPSIHPDFAEIIDDTVSLRNRYAPHSRISVLTNATMLHREEIVEALKKTDLPILKLDSAIESTIELINQPAKKIPVAKRIEQLQSFGKQCIIQTMFLRGTYCGQTVDNVTPEELDAYERAIVAIRPAKVMVYTIARNTPTDTLRKVSGDVLREIAGRIEKYGISVQVAE